MDLGLKINFPYNIEIDPETRDLQLPGATFHGRVENTILKIPFSFNAGIVYHLFPEFSLAADLLYKPWSQISIDNPVNEEVPEFDLHSIHLGLEYTLDLNSFAIPLRAGYHMQPTQIRENNGEQLRLNVFAIGSGIRYKKLLFDISLERMPISYEIDNFYFDPDYSLNNVSFSGDYFRIRLDLGLSLNYPQEDPE
jgi:hypothetical protein